MHFVFLLNINGIAAKQPVVKMRHPKVSTIRESLQRVKLMSRQKILSNPRPDYTEDARHNNVNGLVVLRVVLAASGEVTSITVVGGLPYGLSEKAIEVARKIKFEPAQKDGRPVSQQFELTFTFRLY